MAVILLPFAWELGKAIGRRTYNTPMARLWRANLAYPNYYNDPSLFHSFRNVVMGLSVIPYAMYREIVHNFDEFTLYHSDRVLDLFMYTPPEPWHSLYEQRNFGDVFREYPQGQDSVKVDRILQYW